MVAIFFFDDSQLLSKHNLTRRVGRPEFVPEATFLDPNADLGFAYPSVFPRADGGWRCLYQGIGGGLTPGQPRYMAALVADSDDGVHWHVPDLTDRVAIDVRRTPNQVMPAPSERFGEWGPCFYDERAEDPKERIKGFVCKGHGPGTGIKDSWIVVSPDGLTWEEFHDRRWHPYGSDPAVSAFWNRRRSTYVLAIRPNNGDRRIAVMETPDWEHFSPVEYALGADALDPDLAEIYGMPVFPYDDIFVGLVWLYRVTPTTTDFGKFVGGKIDVQLAYSLNGWHFHRSLRHSFIPNAEPGQFGAGTMITTSMVRLEDEIRLYSCASRIEHAARSEKLGNRSGAVVMHRMRPDAFMYLESGAGQATMRTRAMLVKGDRLTLNVQAPDGCVRVAVRDLEGKPIEGYDLEDCRPFDGDSLDWQPVWKGGGFERLTKKAVSLEVAVMSARVYAIRGDFEMLTAKEGMRYVKHGTPPDPKNW